jgi:hypothetical protein
MSWNSTKATQLTLYIPQKEHINASTFQFGFGEREPRVFLSPRLPFQQKKKGVIE